MDVPIRAFPKCKYHPDGRGVVVQDAGEELALGEGWVDLVSQLPLPAPEMEGSDPDPAVPVPGRRPRGRPRKE